MYHAHFALREEPFGASPDNCFFMQTEQHREALATLYYAIRQRRGFALLVGRAGLGKTSVLVQLLQMLEGEAETAYLPHPYFDRTNVLESILLSLGLNATGSLAQDHRLFYKFLTDTRKAGKTCVVIFDEAQDLNHDTLETIRMLSNFETPSEKLVQIVLAGQPRLADTLKKPECEQIRQRLNVIARLRPLASPDVHEYVSHRVRAAGGAASLFSLDAIDAIAAASGGVPRNINTICFNSLTLAYAVGNSRVGAAEVAEALHDLDLAGELNLPPDKPASHPSFFAERAPAKPTPAAAVSVAPAATGNPVLDVPVPSRTPTAAPDAKANDLPPFPAAILGFQAIEPSFRSAFIAGSVTLLVACTLLWRGLS